MFDGIIGNNDIKQELIKVINLEKLSHSYLFIGTEGIGKKLIAKDFAKMILCLARENDYCDVCKSCVEFNTNNNPDFALVEPDGSSIKIEQIRQMQKKIWEPPIISNKKIYIINNADLMTQEAQNCLLKTLEEPPEFVIIILIGAKENNFLSTIKSRCTIIKFQNISDIEIKQYLKNNYGISDISENLLKISQGSIGKAENYRDKQELYNSIFEIIDNIKELDFINFLKKADLIYKYQDEKKEILESLNVILFEKSKKDIRFLNCIDIIENTKKRLNANGNYNMCVDNMLFNIWEEMH